VSDQLCGRTRGTVHHTETWKENIENATKEKRSLYIIWDKERTDRTIKTNCKASAVSKKLIAST